MPIQPDCTQQAAREAPSHPPCLAIPPPLPGKLLYAAGPISNRSGVAGSLLCCSPSSATRWSFSADSRCIARCSCCADSCKARRTGYGGHFESHAQLPRLQSAGICCWRALCSRALCGKPAMGGLRLL